LIEKAVIARACGISSTLWPFDSIIDVSEYWIARFRGRRRLGVWRGGRMKPSLRAKRSNPSRRVKEEWIASLRSQ